MITLINTEKRNKTDMIIYSVEKADLQRDFCYIRNKHLIRSISQEYLFFFLTWSFENLRLNITSQNIVI